MSRGEGSTLRSATVWFLGVLSISVDAVLIMVTAPILGPARANHALFPPWVRHTFRLFGVGLCSEGWDELPPEIREGRQPVIFMSNHLSYLDPLAMAGVIPVPVAFMAKREVQWLPLIGWAARASGYLFVDRRNGRRARVCMDKAARRIRQGRSLALFPEGTRSRTGELVPFKKGVFALAQDADVPVVPVATLGGHEVLRPGSMRVGRGSYRVAFGQPVHPGDHPDRESFMAEVRRRIEALSAAPPRA